MSQSTFITPIQRGLLLLAVAYRGLWGLFYASWSESASTWLLGSAAQAAEVERFGVVIIISCVGLLAVMLYPRVLGKALAAVLVVMAAAATWFTLGPAAAVVGKKLAFHLVLNEALWVVLFLRPAGQAWLRSGR